MKGLLRKEFIMIWKNFRLYMVLCMFFLIFGVWNENAFFLLFYPAMLCSLIPVSVLNFDEKTGWDRYSLCFPLSRKQLVGSKYLISLICSLVICSLYALAWTVKVLITGDAGEAADILYIFVPTLLTIGLLPPTILLPCVFKFGSQKGSYAYYAVIALLMAVVVSVMKILGDSVAAFAFLDFLNLSRASIFLLPLAAAVLFTLSWPLSSRIYAKKDF